MSRRSPRLLAFFCCSLLSVEVAGGQTLELPSHPNHYIVLVDASGSTTSSDAKRRLYEKGLHEILVSKLYERGFGSSIPPYDPERDRLTLLHFGIVEGPTATAYSHLSEYDLSTDLIHVRFAQKPGVSPTLFKSAVFPTNRYQYTILSWAKQLALQRISLATNSEITARTFLILIHDGLPNENSIAAEIEMIRLWSNANYNKTSPLIASIDQDYRFTNGHGAQGPALAEPLGLQNHTSQFFVEAYEVLSASDTEWLARGRSMQSFGSFRVRWLNESGDKPRGLLVTELNREFVEWTEAAESVEVSLGLDNTAYSAKGLELPFVLSEGLTCAPPKLNVTLAVALLRRDPILGAHTFNYSAPQVVTAPPPLRCTALFILVIALVGLLILVFLFAAIYYLYYRRFKTHLYLDIPGTFHPIRFGRKGASTAIVPMVPQRGLEAFDLRLPNRITQWFLYRGAQVSISTGADFEALGWYEQLGSPVLQLPVVHERTVPAHWRHLPTEPVRLTVALGQGQQRSQINLTYPRALGSPTRSEAMNNENVKAWVALDLGSESMAAYYEDQEGRGGMINLQAHSLSLLNTGVMPTARPYLLMEGTRVSPRLWNRISFKAGAQPRHLDDAHASLEFVRPTNDGADGERVLLPIYERSLFRFFHSIGDWPHPAGVLPNPKILFQQQVMDILAAINVPATDGGHVELIPETLIQHLTLQVIVNFVLNSIELSRYQHDEIHLTITVPNVYSLPHAESIRNFIRNNSPNVADVQVLSESDAVAYYALRRIDEQKDSPELIKFKNEWTKELQRTGRICLVTIDVGKGTTDLSCILVENPRKQRSLIDRIKGRGRKSEESQQRLHSVQAKTGKSSGGNYLNYIFARYYDDRLKTAVEANPPGLTNPLPFGFVFKPASDIYLRPQAKALAALEGLIDQVKTNMTEDFDVALSTEIQRVKLGEVVDEILTSIKEDWRNGTQEEQSTFENLRNQLMGALWLPNHLTTPTLWSRFRKLFTSKNSTDAKQDADLIKPSRETEALRAELERYVKENVDQLLDNLQGLVREHQAISDDKANIDGSAFVIISGQGSQFRPLRAAINRRCNQMSIGEGQVLPMKGIESKEACCKGVVNFWRDNMLVVNERELHGTYGCMDFMSGAFEPFDMKAIKNGGKATLEFDIKSTYLVIFTPRCKEEIEDNAPRINDGATALLRVFPNESRFTIEYKPETLELTVNEERLAVGNFGNVDSKIYEKVWPEILEPHKQ